MSEYVMEYDGWAEGVPAGEYLKVRNAMHARKREEIVRCRDCKHYVDVSGYVDRELHSCTHWGDWTTSNGFCAWGERRDA